LFAENGGEQHGPGVLEVVTVVAEVLEQADDPLEVNPAGSVSSQMSSSPFTIT